MSKISFSLLLYNSYKLDVKSGHRKTYELYMPKNQRKNVKFLSFWAYSRCGCEFHPVKKGFYGYREDWLAVYAQYMVFVTVSFDEFGYIGFAVFLYTQT